MSIDSRLAAKLARVKGLPSPPRVAMRIIEAARDPDISLAKVAEVVTADPVISAKIMRMANSAAYTTRGNCTTLRRALLTLGLDATLIVALSFSLVISLKRDKSAGLDHDYFWRRSLMAATAAAALANALKRTDGEALFLAALLQDIGMLALDKCEPSVYSGAGDLQRDHLALSEFEVGQLGCDHADVGGWLLDRWKLPQELVEAVISSHDRRVFADDEFARCVALSGPLADVWLASDWNHSFRQLVSMAVDRLGLDDTQLCIVLDSLRSRIPETESMFEKDLLHPETGFAALEEARELVMERSVFPANNERAVGEQTHAPVTLLRLQHRTELNEILLKEFQTARAAGVPVGVVMAGIDSLDHVIEKHGTDTADRLLREAARVMLAQRGSRVVGQYSRNEIIVLLENCNHEATRLAGRRILREFRSVLERFSGENNVQVSLALGVAAMDEDHSFDNLASLLSATQSALANARFGSLATAGELSEPAEN